MSGMRRDPGTPRYELSRSLWHLGSSFKTRARDTAMVINDDPVRWVRRYYLPGSSIMYPDRGEELPRTESAKRDIADEPGAASQKRHQAERLPEEGHEDTAFSEAVDEGEGVMEWRKTCIRSDGELLNLSDYLISTEFTDHLRTGKEKLKILANSKFRGGFLCDAIGLGKSLTARTAAIEISQSKLPHCGFNLIVCRPACVHQWYDEIRKHFDDESRPSCRVLDSVDTPVVQLLEYNFVICTTQFLRKIFREVVEQRDFADVAHLFSVEAARRHCALLLTGTPIFNTWHDLAGQTALLPGGGPFVDLNHSLRIFWYSSDEVVDHPQGDKLEMFTKLMNGMLISRPKFHLNLPPTRTHEVKVDFTGKWKSVFMISRYVAIGKSLLCGSNRSGGKGAGKSASKGFAMLVKAPQWAADPILRTAQYLHDDEESNNPNEKKVDELEGQVDLVFEAFRQKHTLPPDLDMDHLSPQQINKFHIFWRQTHGGSYVDQPEVSESGETPSSDAPIEIGEADNIDTGEELSDDIFSEAGQLAYQDEGFVYTEDADDGTYDPDSDRGELRIIPSQHEGYTQSQIRGRRALPPTERTGSRQVRNEVALETIERHRR
ncbi:hypothetical protein QQZ08_002627 [Neonectria magnoliae]|uniref:Helicase ATP-binding domain-containing protein n=1 Tax=Neonectria magnoliae TaxID=2732573 RepID=A0ABR1IB52_9HYPO